MGIVLELESEESKEESALEVPEDVSPAILDVLDAKLE
jgi:hypothetical protein